MEFLYLIFYACMRLRFLDLETNHGVLDCPVCRILCSNVRSLAGNLSDLTVASSQYDNTVVVRDFGLRYASRVGVAGSRIRPPCLVVPGQDASGRIRTRWLRSISPTQI